MLSIGQEYRHNFQFSQEEVNKFAEVTGDKNPLHLDPAYAAQTIFQRPIMHGMLGASIFSKVFGTLFPGEGTIYLKQSLQFLAPMFVDTSYTAIFTVQAVDTEKHRVTIKTEIINPEGKTTITGEALLQNPAIK
ncbi:MAG: MaoC family dehydratase [Bacteroidia bacterium]|nr:MaoC family dehydratase [Bacteroidia bacterium]MDW8157718.1 MaoC family dehydratase [Bacteroidia bacterium]